MAVLRCFDVEAELELVEAKRRGSVSLDGKKKKVAFQHPISTSSSSGG
ncbi:MAG: hypothetical protein QWI73_04995 [Alphaproteobacteria bacterium]|nr:hypothetical protein [Alphaproteobacteria bacterium]